jgi:hypothetical protein
MIGRKHSIADLYGYSARTMLDRGPQNRQTEYGVLRATNAVLLAVPPSET